MRQKDWTIVLAAYACTDDEESAPELWADQLTDAVADHDGAVQAGATAYQLTFTVEAAELRDALEQAWPLHEKFVAAAGPDMPRWAVLEMRAVLADLEDDVEELVTAAEVAVMLGVTRSRVHQLAKDHPEFPDPRYELDTGRVWSKQAIKEFDAGWERRRTGRPRKVQP
jgi:hypothetical protein